MINEESLISNGRTGQYHLICEEDFLKKWKITFVLLQRLNTKSSYKMEGNSVSSKALDW